MITNGYIAFYNGKKTEVHAETSLSARDLALVEFKKLYPRRKIQGFDVNIVLCDTNTENGKRFGDPVYHTPT